MRLIDKSSEIHFSHFEENGFFSDPFAADYSKLILAWYAKHREPLPWRLLWEEKQDPYPVYLSEIMLQQTTIATVLPIFKKFIRLFPTPKHYAEACEAELMSHLKGIGYYSRFRRLQSAIQILIESSETGTIVWPQTYEDWRKLPGIGEYTASALASIINRQPYGVLDGNVERILCRINEVHLPVNLPKLKKYYRKMLQPIVDTKNPGDFNQGLMELGQKICRPINPNCERCPLSQLCLAYKNHTQTMVPKAKQKKQFIEKEIAILIPMHKSKVGITSGHRGGRFLKSYPGFPIIEFESKYCKKELTKHLSTYGTIKSIHKTGIIKHSITHHKLTGHCVVIDFSQGNLINSSFRFLSAREDLEQHLMTSLDQKAFKKSVSYLK